MICERVLGHISEAVFETATERDFLDLTWQECAKRFLRKTTRAGREAGLLLPAGCQLQDGDVVYASGELVIAIAIEPVPVLVIGTTTPDSIASVAYLLGEMHCPIELAAGEIITPADDAIAAVLSRLKLPHTREARRFQPLVSSAPSAWTSSAEIRRNRRVR